MRDGTRRFVDMIIREFSLVILLVIIMQLIGCEGPKRPNLDGGPVCPGAPPGANPNEKNPPGDLPASLRHRNWTYRGEGSCHVAAWCDVLNHHNMPELSRWWRRNRGGATSWRDIVKESQGLDLPVAWTTRGNADFLEAVSRTGRISTIYWTGGRHAVTFLGFRDGKAYMVDNNSPKTIRSMPKEELLRLWRSAGGYSVTLCSTPNPPIPWTLKKGSQT